MHKYLSRGITALAIILGANAGFLISINMLTGDVPPVVMSETRVSGTLTRNDLSYFATVVPPSPAPAIAIANTPAHEHYKHYSTDELAQAAASNANVRYYTDLAKSGASAVLGSDNRTGARVTFVPVLTTNTDALAEHQMLAGCWGTVYESQPKLNAVAPAVASAAEADSQEPSADSKVLALAAILALCSLILSSRKKTELRKTGSFLCAAWALGFMCNALTLLPAICLAFAGFLAGIFLEGKEDKVLLTPARLEVVNIALSVGTLGVASVNAYLTLTHFSAMTLAFPMCLVHCAKAKHLRFSARILRLASLASLLFCASAIVIPLGIMLSLLSHFPAWSSLAFAQIIVVPSLLVAGALCLTRVIERRTAAALDAIPGNGFAWNLRQSLMRCVSASVRICSVFPLTVAACFVTLAGAVFAPGALGDLLTGWITESVRDANLPTDFVNLFSAATKIVLFSILCAALTSRILQFGAMASSFAERVKRRGHWLHHAAMSIKAQRSGIVIRDKAPVIKAVGLTIIWYSFCYVSVFSLWMFINLKGWNGWPTSRYNFLAQLCFASSHAAAISAYLLAIMTATWLPRIAPCEVVVSNDGLLVNKGFLASLRLRPYRRWNDLAGVSLEGASKRRSLLIQFASGGTLKLRLSQLAGANLSRLLIAIDEHAPQCLFSDEINKLLSIFHGENASGIEHLQQNEQEEIKLSSTTFSTLENGFTFADRNVRILRLLASKSFSATYLVRSGNNLAILKQISTAGRDRCNAGEDFAGLEQQVEPLAKLNHPHLAKLISSFRSADQDFVLTEFVNGTSLTEAIEKGEKLSRETLDDVARQIAQTLHYLHSQSEPLVHGAIHPNSFMFMPDGSVKLIDFGIIDRLLEESTGTVVGDAAFASPERIRGCAVQQSDIYSFGATMYFLATGHAPIALRQCQMQSFAGNISNELADLVVRCTAFNQKERPGSFGEILRALGADADPTQTSATDRDHHAHSKAAEDDRANTPRQSAFAHTTAQNNSLHSLLDASEVEAQIARPISVESIHIIDIGEKEQA